ncbi:MAG: F0F1 ATP synthase subunit A [Candidatus Eisenbacteria bacterium]|nr:F0F1 ATP synthase subunit A [Candidatus Eisenbacteria bacterium]
MGLEFYLRGRNLTLFLSILASLFGATYHSPSAALGFLAGTLWSILNFELIRSLVSFLSERHLAVVPEPFGGAKSGVSGWGPIPSVLALFRTVWRNTGKKLQRMLEGHRRIKLVVIVAIKFPVLYGLGWVLLASDRLPIYFLLAGYTLPFAVIFLKAVGSALTSSSSRPTPSPCPLPKGERNEENTPAGAPKKLLFLVPFVVPFFLYALPSLTFSSEAKKEGGAPELPNIIILLAEGIGNVGWAEFLERYQNIFFSWLIIIGLSILGYLASRRPAMVPGKFQNGVELVVEQIENLIVGILGERGRELVPFLGTLFIYIFSMNLFGLIPGMKSPSSSLSTTAALGITVFFYVQYSGIRNLGFLGYFHHLAGSPRDVIGWAMVPIMLPVHILGELIKPVSLSCRLFGNIFGEDVLIAVFVGLGVTILSFLHLPVGIPLQLPFIFLALLTSAVQALIFTLLSTIYFLLMFPHEESH